MDRIPVSDVVIDDHLVDGMVMGFLDGCMWSGSSSSLVAMRREKAGIKVVVRRKLRSCQVRLGQATQLRPTQPIHMLNRLKTFSPGGIQQSGLKVSF